ncbi:MULTISPECIES: glycosyltransferase family 4 protein [Fischerella]|uniref:Glycosyl transferase n=1 Tax=Fischerella muscicola CCMEE 5323 TaxID=2019572 RepID=A0A2N6K9C7_FISMU|nr:MULTISPECIES: glycosyltransferase family 4 protein [Fischerella]MBD2434055.1 glycosyltransferase family 4 protein [Fischerella sp. FACHB-380]PLZ94614.1 glycosyl transferase [Fischerella muscicola CCMEE 5323]
MIKVFILSSGLGYIQRGYESFSQELFDALSQNCSLDVTLFKGNGKPSSKEIVVWNIPYYGKLAQKISEFFKKPERRDPYFTQQVTFFLSFLPHLYLKKPDIIFFTEPSLGTLLWHWRSITKQSYQFLFCNGGPCSPNIFYRWDRVLQVAPTHFQSALDIGVAAEKQTLIPHAIHIPSEPIILSDRERELLRHKLGLPEKRPLILSVAAINKSRKRMDYVISEIAHLPEPRPYLLLLGHQGEEAREIIQLGNSLLGVENFQIRTVDKNEVADYYKVADAFVLASLYEGFGLVFLEAMSHGLPCLAHDYEVPRYILGKEGYFANFELAGSLANLIPQALAESHDISKRRHRHHTVYERFSWDKLRPEYVKLIQQCVNS